MDLSNKNDIKVSVLGSGSCVPLFSRFPASYVLNINNSVGYWLLDLGGGALQRLSQTAYSYKDVEYIFISHTHPDHFGSLLPLFQALNYTPGYIRNKELNILGSSDVKKYIDHSLEYTPKMKPKFPIKYWELTDNQHISINNYQLLPLQLAHSAEVYGIRLSIGDYSIAYGADSGPCEQLISLVKDVDLAILECSFGKLMKTSTHLTTSTAGEVARKGKVKKLLLSHFYPELLYMGKEQIEKEVRESGYTGEIILAEDLMVINN